MPLFEDGLLLLILLVLKVLIHDLIHQLLIVDVGDLLSAIPQRIAHGAVDKGDRLARPDNLVLILADVGSATPTSIEGFLTTELGLRGQALAALP